MRLTMSREAPTRSAISCCVIFSGMTDLPSLLSTAMSSRRRATRPYTSRSARCFTLFVARRARSMTLAIISRAKSGFWRIASRIGSRVSVERHLAHVFAGSVGVEDHLVAFVVGDEDLDLSLEHDEERVARIPFGDEDA